MAYHSGNHWLQVNQAVCIMILADAKAVQTTGFDGWSLLHLLEFKLLSQSCHTTVLHA